VLLLLAAHSLLQAEHELRVQSMSSNTSPWCVALQAPAALQIPTFLLQTLTFSLQMLMVLRRALIHHEDKPGVFKFVWYCARQFRHHSFLCSNNGFFVDGKVSANCPCVCALLFCTSLSLPPSFCLLPRPAHL